MDARPSEENAIAKILVVEDDVLVRAVVVDLLEHARHTVLIAEDGQRGLVMFQREQPDLVITDIVMPEQGGIQTLVDIRSVRPDAKVIVMSGDGRIGNTDFLAMARDLGASEIVAKPFDAEDFLHCVARCLAREQSPAPAP